jgi:hypothetical protein
MVVTSSTVYDNTLKDLDLTGYNATLTWTLINTGACTGAGLCGSNSNNLIVFMFLFQVLNHIFHEGT